MLKFFISELPVIVFVRLDAAQRSAAVAELALQRFVRFVNKQLFSHQLTRSDRLQAAALISSPNLLGPALVPETAACASW